MFGSTQQMTFSLCCSFRFLPKVKHIPTYLYPPILISSFTKQSYLIWISHNHRISALISWLLLEIRKSGGDVTDWRSSHSSPNNGTTPWPALGQRHRPNINFENNPTWVRPNQRSNVMTNWQRRDQNSNFNAGSRGNNQNRNATSNIPNSGEVKDDELREFSESLLNKDVNNAAKYVTINLQSKTTSRSERDEAPLP
jgi:hypothetical protein